MTTFSRRTLLRTGAAGASLVTLSLGAWALRIANAQKADPVAGPYGPLSPVLDETTGLPLLQLPKGFRYQSFSWAGDLMGDGASAPNMHDGMAVIRSLNGKTTLIRNHEVGAGPLLGASLYDDVVVPTEIAQTEGPVTVGGGTTTLTYENGQWRSARPSLGGTLINCSGGPTPWGSWLSCEETVTDLRQLGGKLHGFVFEVPAEGVASAVPLTAMGLFSHEAVAIDPNTSIAYLTEDNGDTSGLYRFLPANRTQTLRALEDGGILQMLKVTGQRNADLTTPKVGDRYDAEWVDIADPVMLPENQDNVLDMEGRSGPYMQGEDQGAAKFKRLEGAFFHDGSLYFADTSAGAAEFGVIWRYDPDEEKADAGGLLTALFVSPNPSVGNRPDNLTLSPRNELYFCEDGDDQPQRIMGLLPSGDTFPFVGNNVALDEGNIKTIEKPLISPGDYRFEEWAGATFSPDGETLFVNIQTPGITFAITGPWKT
ncbi:MAG: phosphatase [Hyphococcus sp.]|nr:MAG: phosphatase [Marinicaulis sp.]